MDYNFRYKSKFEKRSFQQKVNKVCSDFLFSIYDNWLFKKLKLDKNKFLRDHILFGKKRELPNHYKSKIPKEPNLKAYSITFLDCIELEDSQKLKNSLIKIVSKYKGGFLTEDPEKKLNKAFAKFNSDYKTISWGKLFYNNTKENEELDLIDGISYRYVKGAQSHFIITYTIYPSEKFNQLFLQSLNQKIKTESEIKFKSLKQIVKKKGLFSSIDSNFKSQDYWSEKLFNEVTHQFKTLVISDLNLGVFNLSNVLLPRITSFEYDPIEFKVYQDEIFRKLNIRRHDFYTNSDIIFSLNKVDYSKKSSFGLEIFIPYKSDEEKRKDPFYDVSYLSSNYIEAIASYWTLINLSCLRKRSVVKLRQSTFKYIRKNKISLFLKKIIHLKNELTLNWISFERIRKDFTMDIFKNQLNFNDIPDALNLPWLQGIQPDEFKKSLVNYSVNTSTDIKNSYEELLELHTHIAEDSSLRASMKLQRLLFLIALIGIILALYSSNTNWCNSWIEFFLNKINLEIPRIEESITTSSNA